MTRIHNRDLVLHPSANVNPDKWSEGKYDGFVDELCRGREYQKEAIFAVLRYLLSDNYPDLRALARENYNNNPKLSEAYGSREAMEARLQFPDTLSCSLDLATGTGKSYVLYGLAAIMLAEGAVDRVLTLCPSRTIERGLLEKFRQLAADDNLRALMPGEYAPRIVDASETVADGCVCVENYHAILEHVGSSIRASFKDKGARTLVLNDESHHVATSSSDSKKWKGFLQDEKFGFRRIVGVSGTCYVGNDYFADVVSRYSLRQAIEERVVKNVAYVTEAPKTRESEEKWQLIYQRHKKSASELKRRRIRPLTIIVTATISGCENVAEELRAFLQEQEGITPEMAKEKVMVVTSSAKHQRDVARLGMVDNPQGKTEWIVSVSMLTEGWDVKNVFQIVPHEERAFNSKLLIAQVLGRGLRIPEPWQNGQPRVTVFNHENWSARIQHLVNEVLDIEQRASSLVIADSSHHFNLHNLDYKTEAETQKYRKKGEYNIFKDGYIALPTARAKESVRVAYEQVRGGRQEERMTIHHKTHTAREIAKHMHRHLLAVDEENAANSKERTNYAVKFPLQRLEGVVRESVKRANIDEQAIPEEIRQKFMGSMNVLKRVISKRVTYRTEAESMILATTGDRQAVSCSAAELRSGVKTVFLRSDCVNYLPKEQHDFFAKLADEDGEFSGAVRKIDNNFHFKSPVNLAIADHTPERRFMSELCKAENAAVIHGWIKNADMGFYAVEYAWSKERSRAGVSHTKRGMFSPDFFIKDARNERIYVVEIKSDDETTSPSRENVAKHTFAKEHFDRLNKWLEENGDKERYRFNMLTPNDYDVYFACLREKNLDRYNSHLDVAIVEAKGNNGNNGG